MRWPLALLAACPRRRVRRPPPPPHAHTHQVVDIWEQSSLPKQCIVCVAMDAHGFWDLMIDAIHRADLHSPLNTQ